MQITTNVEILHTISITTKELEILAAYLQNNFRDSTEDEPIELYKIRASIYQHYLDTKD